MEAWHKVRYYWVTDVKKVLLIRCSLRVSHHQSVARPDPAAQERERLLSTLQEEASIAKDKVKQLSQVSTFVLCSAGYMMLLELYFILSERSHLFIPNDSHHIASVRQELQIEKQKTNRVEAVMREQRATMEKELGSMQNKAQSNFQELQSMQMKVGAFLCFHMFFFSCCQGTYVR